LRRNRGLRADEMRCEESEGREEEQTGNGHERKRRTGCVYLAEAARNARQTGAVE
jgi:hypothetical protein